MSSLNQSYESHLDANKKDLADKSNYKDSILSSSLEKQVDEPQTQTDSDIDGGYGYVIIFTAFLLNFSTWGMNSGFAIYFTYYLNEGTFKGASKIDYSLIGGLAFGLGLMFSPVINYLQGKIGIKYTIILGNCFQFTSLMLASWSTKLWQLYLTQGVLQSFGLGFISLPALTLIPQYFRRKRTLASGLASAGSGAGGICFNLAMQKVLDSRSVHWALRCQSIISFGLVWIAILLIREKSKQHHIQFTLIDKECLQNGGFWLVCFFLTTCMFGYVVVLYTLADFTTSLGYSSTQGSLVSAMVQLGSCLGRPSVGRLSDSFGAITVASIAYTICSILCLAMWIPCRNYATTIIFAIMIGGTMGSVYGIIAPMVARLVGMPKLNVAFCMLWCFQGVAGLVSPVIGVKLITGSGGNVDPTQYRDCSIFTGVSFFAAGSFLVALRGYVIARDSLAGANVDSDKGDHLKIAVPFKLSLTSCFKRSIKNV